MKPFQKPPPGWIFGLDVGQSQGPIDVPALRAAGVSFLYVRCTDGENDLDPRFEETAAACVADGMDFGCYGVLEDYGTVRAPIQAEHFVRYAKGSGATLPPMMDFELSRGQPASVALASAVLWRDDVQKDIGVRPIIYAGPAFLEHLEQLAGAAGAGSAIALGTSALCVAAYTQDQAKMPPVPPPWGAFTIWQCSGGRASSRNYATLPWNDTDVDVELFKGTVADLVGMGTPLAVPVAAAGAGA